MKKRILHLALAPLGRGVRAWGDGDREAGLPADFAAERERNQAQAVRRHDEVLTGEGDKFAW